MGDPATCTHDLYWHPAPANEQGWKCVACKWQPGEPPGFSPQHDRELVDVKVGCILQLLHESEVIYVSNGTGADRITAEVARRCFHTDVYDSVSIARMILEIEGSDRHRDFWHDISSCIIAGRDPRPRCSCGQLATVSSGEFRACSHEHMQLARGRNPEDPW